MKKSSIRYIFLAALFFINAALWYAVFYGEAHRNLSLTMFDVGQGDAIFIETPNGNQVLIDGGPNDRLLPKLGRVMPFWDRSIDLLVLTHAHADHVDGLVEVLRRYHVGMVLESGEEYSTPDYHEWQRIVQEKKIPLVAAKRGEIAHVGSSVEIRILSPFENSQGVAFKNPHDANVSAKLIYGNTTALLMGDAEKGVEYRLLAADPEVLRADILKVGHHGSKTSSVEDFLRAVMPRIAVISVGRHNRYGHPHQEVLDRLHDLGIAVLRTDENGDVRFESDGTTFTKIK